MSESKDKIQSAIVKACAGVGGGPVKSLRSYRRLVIVPSSLRHTHSTTFSP